MLVEKKNNLIRLTSFVLILALIFSIPMFGQSDNVYAEEENTTIAGVEKPAEEERIASPAGTDVDKAESGIAKIKDKKDSDKQAKASNPATFTFDVSEGDIVISDGANAGTLKVTYGASLSVDNIAASQFITIVGNTEINNVAITAATNVNTHFKNVAIDVSAYDNKAAVNVNAGSTLNIALSGKNQLKSGKNGAGIYVPQGAILLINAYETADLLNVTGGANGAGIGGMSSGDVNAGYVRIADGTIVATGGQNAAGIGGSFLDKNNRGNGGNILIVGGYIEASTVSRAAGIGGGAGGNGGTIQILGGVINAKAADGGAGIGGGGYDQSRNTTANHGGRIEISGGDITALGGNGAGIGGGGGDTSENNSSSGGSINISGGRISANSYFGSDIGIGRFGTTVGSIVVIRGGSVKATKVSPQATNYKENVYCNTLTIGSPNIGDDKEISSLHIDGRNSNIGLKDAKTMDGGKLYFWLPLAKYQGTPENVEAVYNNSTYGYRYSRDAKPQAQTLKNSFEVSGIISGAPNVSGVAVAIKINGIESSVETDSSGRYNFIAPIGAEVYIYTPEIVGYYSTYSHTYILDIYMDILDEDYYYYPSKYRLTFNAEDALVGKDNKTVTYDAAYGDLPIATKAGYTFNGWHTTTSYAVEITSGSIVKTATNHALYAKLIANDYVVSFDANGGNASKTTMSATYKDPYGELATASRTGYTFDGWYTTTSYAVEITSGSIMETMKDHTLYAKWEVNDYEVSFDANGGNAPSKTTMGATYDAPYGTLATTSRTGYTFDGWYSTTAYAVEITSGSIVNTADDHTLYAKWKANDYVVSFNSNGGNAPSKTTMDATYDDPYGTLATVSRTGYTFNGWYTTGYAVEITSGSIVNIDDDHTLYAKWTANEYTITFNKNGGNSVSPSTKVVTYDSEYGTLATAVKSGYTFEGWFTSQTGGTEIKATDIVDITADTTLYARWSANSYSISFDSNGGTAPNPSTKDVTRDESYGELPSVSREGYTFIGWYKAPSGRTEITANSIVKLTDDASFYARWIANDYIVTFDLNGGDEASRATKKVTYDYKHGQLPTATKAGYTFSGWHTATTGGVEVKSTDSVNYTNDTTLYAKWTANDYKVSLDVNGGNKLTDNSKTVTKDSTYGNLPTPTKKGHAFQGWFTAKTGGTKITADTKVETTSDQILYAQWKAKTYKITFKKNAKKVKKLKPNSKKVVYGTKLGKLPKPKKSGFKFKGWYIKKKGGTKVTMKSIMKYDKNIKLYAKWAKKKGKN